MHCLNNGGARVKRPYQQGFSEVMHLCTQKHETRKIDTHIHANPSSFFYFQPFCCISAQVRQNALHKPVLLMQTPFSHTTQVHKFEDIRAHRHLCAVSPPSDDHPLAPQGRANDARLRPASAQRADGAVWTSFVLPHRILKFLFRRCLLAPRKPSRFSLCSMRKTIPFCVRKKTCWMSCFAQHPLPAAERTG